MFPFEPPFGPNVQVGKKPFPQGLVKKGSGRMGEAARLNKKKKQKKNKRPPLKKVCSFHWLLSKRKSFWWRPRHPSGLTPQKKNKHNKKSATGFPPRLGFAKWGDPRWGGGTHPKHLCSLLCFFPFLSVGKPPKRGGGPQVPRWGGCCGLGPPPKTNNP